jgi:hypothetical protein
MSDTPSGCAATQRRWRLGLERSGTVRIRPSLLPSALGMCEQLATREESAKHKPYPQRRNQASGFRRPRKTRGCQAWSI